MITRIVSGGLKAVVWGLAATGFAAASQSYAAGWHSYLSSLPPPPASARGYKELYDVSLMVLNASEDKTWRGGFIARSFPIAGLPFRAMQRPRQVGREGKAQTGWR